MSQTEGRNPNLRILGLAIGCIGIKEQGNNAGPEIEAIQKAIFGIADHQSYCMAFLQAKLKIVEKEFELKSKLFVSGSVLQTWLNSQPLKVLEPLPGDIVIWKTGPDHGHTGVYRKALSKTMFQTVEANTSSGEAGSQQDGDGIYGRNRHLASSPGFTLLGFLRCFPA